MRSAMTDESTVAPSGLSEVRICPAHYMIAFAVFVSGSLFAKDSCRHPGALVACANVQRPAAATEMEGVTMSAFH